MADDPFAKGMMTRAQFAQAYREKYKDVHPEWSSIPDDQLVDNFLSVNPKWRTRIIGAAAPMTGTAKIGGPASDIAPSGGGRSPALREAGYDVGNWMAELPPAITSAIGAAMMAPTGPGGMIAGAGAGSVPGSLIELGAKRLLFPPSKGWEPLTAESASKTIMKNLALNTAFEGLGRGAQYLPGGPRALRLAMKELERPENLDVLGTSKEFDLGLTYPQIAPSPRNIVRYSAFPRSMKEPALMMERGDEAIIGRGEQAVGGLPEKAFGRQAVTGTRDVSGRIVQEETQRTGERLFKEQSGKLYSDFNLRAQGMTAKPGAIDQIRNALKQEMKERKATRKQLTRQGAGINELLQRSDRTREIYRDILRLPDNAPVTALNELRSRLMKETPSIIEPISGEAPGQAKFFVRKLTEVIDDAIRGTPAEGAWKSYRSFYDKGADVFESRQVVDMLNKEPEKFTSYVGPQDITAAKRMRSAIMGYAQGLGTAQDKATAMSAWNRFRAQWVNENLLTGDITGLSGRIKAIDPEVLRTILHDPDGKRLLRNATRIGAAIDRVTMLRGAGTEQSTRYLFYRLGYHAGTAGLGGASAFLLGAHSPIATGLAATGGVAIGEAGARAYARILARVLYSPELTEKAIRFTTWLAKNPYITTANAMRVIDRFVESPTLPGRTTPEPEPTQSRILRGDPSIRKPSAGLDAQGKPMAPIDENPVYSPGGVEPQ